MYTTVTQDRLRRLRTAWFVIGSASGLALGVVIATAIAPGTSHDSRETAAAPALVATEAVTAQAVTSTVVTPETSSKVETAAVAAPVELKPMDPAADIAASSQEAPSAAAIAAAAVPSAGDMMFPASLSLRVNGGDTLIKMLTETGVEYEEAQNAVDAIRKIYDPRKLTIGQEVALDLDKSDIDPRTPVISSLSIPVSKTAHVKVTRKGDTFNAKKIEAPLKKKLIHSSAVIKGSLYETGAKAGIPNELMAEIVKAYSYDVDFQRDIKAGQTLNVLYERLQTEEGEIGGYGNVLHASLDLGKRTVNIFRHTDKAGNSDFYNEKGESLRKALLRTPINGARISSGFGMRMHPVMGYSKMHRGVDFAAGYGTPIYAAGDGTVAEAGVKGGYGNYVRIKHNDRYATAYGHISRFAKGIKAGAKVRQGQVIAYVGSTGRSTGPHLHYEVLASNQQINPSSVKFKTGNSLSGKELAAFKSNVRDIQLAMNDSAPGKQQASLTTSAQ